MEGSIVPIVAKKADELAKPFSGAVAGTLAEFWHGIIGDKVVAWRLRNAAKVSEKLEKDVAERGLTLKTAALPESYAYRWFEKASEEDEPELQTLFAKLLANAASGNEAALQRQNIDLISRMTPDAAILFTRVAEEFTPHILRFKHLDFYDQVALDHYHLRSSLAQPVNPIALDLLISMRVLFLNASLGRKYPSGLARWRDLSGSGRIDSSQNLKIEERVVLTHIGLTLVKALDLPFSESL